jgi:hypothetical protein
LIQTGEWFVLLRSFLFFDFGAQSILGNHPAQVLSLRNHQATYRPMNPLRLLPNPVKVHGVLSTNEVDSGARARSPNLGQRDPSSEQHRLQLHPLIVHKRLAHGRPGKVNTINLI